MSGKLVFWGAGEVGRLAIGYAIIRNMEVDCFIDANSSKWGSQYMGLKVYSPDHLSELGGDVEVIITVGSKLQGNVISRLAGLGYIYGKNVFTYQEKFLGGGVPAFSEPGFVDLDDGFSLVKPVTDSFLIIDKSENALFRAIKGEKLEHLKTVYERVNASKRLLECVVPTSIVKHEYLNTISPLVFRHEYIAPLSYAWEWPPAMFRDYVLFMIEFISELDRAGLGLGDPNGSNAIFHGGRFLYLDYSGIHWETTDLQIMRLFIELHVNVLVLMVKNRGKGDLFLRNRSLGMKYEDFSGYLSAAERNEYRSVFGECLDLVEKKHIVDACMLLKQYVVKFSGGMVNVSDWTGYQDEMYQSINEPARWTNKQQTVISLINQASPRTLLDLAGNVGWYCVAKAKDLDYAIVADADVGIMDKAYEIIKQLGVTNVLPVRLNIIAPTPAFYRGHHVICTDAIRPHIKGATERFRCDIVLALAVVHHLALSQGLSFEEIIGQLSLFTNRHLIIEFIDRNDRYVKQYLNLNEEFQTAWYTRERFEAALRKSFNLLVAPPTNEQSRVIYLCEKR